MDRLEAIRTVVRVLQPASKRSALDPADVKALRQLAPPHLKDRPIHELAYALAEELVPSGKPSDIA